MYIPNEETQIYDSNTYNRGYVYLGMAGEEKSPYGDFYYHIEQRNKFLVGETVEIMKKDGTNVETTVLSILDEEGNAMESAPHPKQGLWVNLGVELEAYDIIRRMEECGNI